MEIASGNCGSTNRCRIGVLEGKRRRVRQTLAKVFPNLLKREAHKVLGEWERMTSRQRADVSFPSH